MLDIEDFSSLMISLSICAQDGLISEVEEREVYKLYSERYTKLSEQDFSKYVDEFFNSDDVIEVHASRIKDHDLRKFTLASAKKSAAIDGFDISENIAYKKLCVLWGVDVD